MQTDGAAPADLMLAHRVVAITGAGAGLGRAYALAAGAAGARVVVNDIDATAAGETVALLDGAGAEAHAVVGSVAEPGFGDELVRQSVEVFGTLDGLVNNAGILSPGLSVDQSDDVLRRTVDVNLVGSLRCGVAAMRFMRGQGHGAIVNVVSAALEGLDGLALYGATKGGMMSATYGWALELEGTGVRVNAISPLAHTSMSDLSDMQDDLKGGRADAVAPLVVYLLSGESAALNGQIIRFDGRRLGVVAEPRLVSLSGSRDWTPQDVAGAFRGALGARLRAVGLTAATRAEIVPD